MRAEPRLICGTFWKILLGFHLLAIQGTAPKIEVKSI